MYLYDMVTIAEEHKVPSCLILNLDQTPLKYIPVWRQILAKKGSKLVSIPGSTDSFIITLSGKLLPIQLIYDGNTKESLAPFKFPESFSLSANPKHVSNKAQSLKVIAKNYSPLRETTASGIRKARSSDYLNHGCFSCPDNWGSCFNALHQQYLVD